LYKADILIPVRNEYLLFRQLFESIIQRIPKEDIGNIIVVDDFSSDKKLKKYLKYLSNENLITLIKGFLPLPSFYSRIPIPLLTSRGHGGSINKGLKYVTSNYVLIIDPDTIILRGSLIKDAVKCFDLDDKIVSVGQVVGGIKGVKVIGDKEREDPEFLTEYIKENPHHYGMTNACCMLNKTVAHTEYGLDKFWNKGWAHMPFTKSIFREGYKTCNFDFFIDGYLIHLGRASLKNMKFKNMRIRKFKNGKPPYGMSKETKKYANKEKGEYYGGYLELKIPSDEYDRILEEKYSNLPFDEFAPLTDENFFGPPELNSGNFSN